MSDIKKMEDQIGSLASAYKQTLFTLYHLLAELNSLATQGKVQVSEKLETLAFAGSISMELGKRHFPDFDPTKPPLEDQA